MVETRLEGSKDEWCNVGWQVCFTELHMPVKMGIFLNGEWETGSEKKEALELGFEKFEGHPCRGRGRAKLM